MAQRSIATTALRGALRASGAARHLSTASVGHVRGERRYVRLSGLASYASMDDVKCFLGRNGVELPMADVDSTHTTPLLQGSSDVFQNNSVWVYDAGSTDAALSDAEKLSGRVGGMKLVRASAVDMRIVGDLIDPSSAGAGKRRRNLRRHLGVIAPTPEERGRTVLVTGMPPFTAPRLIWAFFGAFDLIDIRMLRRAGVASAVFRSESEALRAIRERNNSLLQSRVPLYLKMYE